MVKWHVLTTYAGSEAEIDYSTIEADTLEDAYERDQEGGGNFDFSKILSEEQWLKIRAFMEEDKI